MSSIALPRHAAPIHECLIAMSLFTASGWLAFPARRLLPSSYSSSARAAEMEFACQSEAEESTGVMVDRNETLHKEKKTTDPTTNPWNHHVFNLHRCSNPFHFPMIRYDVVRPWHVMPATMDVTGFQIKLNYFMKSDTKHNPNSSNPGPGLGLGPGAA